MEIHIAGTFPTKQASADAFTGTVWHDPIIDAPSARPHPREPCHV